MARVEQRQEFSLTPELWAQVFALVEERSDTIEDMGGWTQTTHRLARQEQAQVHQLKLVCKQFRDIYATHSGLIQRMLLYQSFPARLTPSLLAWLQQNRSSVQTFRSTDESSLVDAVLSALVSTEQCIRLANLCNVSACSISLITSFMNLEKCGLGSKVHDCQWLDLTPLGLLPKLTHLALRGLYSHLYHLTGLTRLDCFSAHIDKVNQMTPSLQHLEVIGSYLNCMHYQGLSSCPALTHLVLSNCILMDCVFTCHWNERMTTFPVNITMLTQLRTLHVSSHAEGFENFESAFWWGTRLTSLQDLTVICDYSHDLLQHALSLANLTRLHIAGVLQLVD